MGEQGLPLLTTLLTSESLKLSLALTTAKNRLAAVFIEETNACSILRLRTQDFANFVCSTALGPCGSLTRNGMAARFFSIREFTLVCTIDDAKVK